MIIPVSQPQYRNESPYGLLICKSYTRRCRSEEPGTRCAALDHDRVRDVHFGFPLPELRVDPSDRISTWQHSHVRERWAHTKKHLGLLQKLIIRTRASAASGSWSSARSAPRGPRLAAPSHSQQHEQQRLDAGSVPWTASGQLSGSTPRGSSWASLLRLSMIEVGFNNSITAAKRRFKCDQPLLANRNGKANISKIYLVLLVKMLF